MVVVEVLVFAVYGFLLLFIFFYSLSQLDILLNFLKQKRNNKKSKFQENFYPKVTIQLPIYNEKYVVERLINATCNIIYPKELLEIQVLDDSTDETKEFIQQLVLQKQNAGINIKHIHRQNRNGFKAGALKVGTEIAEGEFIAIFDADFLPDKNFLVKTIGYFIDEKIGVVQTPWLHINHNYSLLTSLQAFGLNAHFSLEQGGRNANNHFINFNGTGGIWRKECINNAGGWQDDTLTEDLDLSYRAQLKGWKFLFINEVGSPAELPANIAALRTQQFRWTKGAAECARKNLWKVWMSNKPISTKFHATFHLLNSFVFVCVALTAILSIPVMWFKPNWPELKNFFFIGGLFVFSFVLLGIYYWNSSKFNYNHNPKHKNIFLLYFPMFLSFTMGLSLHNAIAVIEGYVGKKTPFIRTPKFNIVTKKDSWKNKAYLSKKISFMSLLEGVFSLYFLGGLFLAFYLKDFGLFPVHLLLFFGFGAIFVYSVAHSSNT